MCQTIDIGPYKKKRQLKMNEKCLLLDISTTAPVCHFDTSPLKATAMSNTASMVQLLEEFFVIEL